MLFFVSEMTRIKITKAEKNMNQNEKCELENQIENKTKI